MNILKQTMPDGILYHTDKILGFMVMANSDEEMTEMINKEIPITNNLTIHYEKI